MLFGKKKEITFQPDSLGVIDYSKIKFSKKLEDNAAV
jgi:hypothetical protein